MKCPHCGHPASKVTDSRASEAGVRRRRECQACAEPFTTYEQYQATMVMVVKKDGRREEFQREKLLRGLRIAARKRPLPAGAIDAIAADIERRLMAAGRAEVLSRVVGEMAITQLKQLDPIAYIRFASVYRQFLSLDDMLAEFQRMTQFPAPPADQPRLFEDELSRLLSGAEELPRAPTPIESAPSVVARR